MKVAKKQNKGFTLIELMIVIVIVGVAASLSWSSLYNVKKRSQVDSACESVAALTNKARSYALAGLPGVDRVRMFCSAGSCSIQSRLGAGTWNTISGETLSSDSDALRAVIVPDIDAEHVIPYASTSTGSGSQFISSKTDSSVTRTLVIDTFKATCQ